MISFVCAHSRKAWVGRSLAPPRGIAMGSRRKRRRRRDSSSSTETHIRRLAQGLVGNGVGDPPNGQSCLLQHSSSSARMPIAGVEGPPMSCDSESLHGFDDSTDEEKGGRTQIGERENQQAAASCGNAEVTREAEEQQSASSSDIAGAREGVLQCDSRSRRVTSKTFDLDGRFHITARPEDYHDLSVVHSRPTDHDVVQAFDVMADIRGLLARPCGHMMAEAWGTLYHGAYPELVCASVEEMLLWTVLRTLRFRQSRLQQRSDNSPGLTHLIEFWAGVGNLTKEHVRLGLTCRRFDMAYSSLHDCTTGPGLRLWIEELTRMAPGGLIWNGTQCSSFVMLSRSKSKRREENGYYGDESRLFVRKGNEQMKVLSLIIAIAALVGVDWVVEQPTSSVLPVMQPLEDVIAFSGGFKVTTWLGAFGAESPKPVQLWCSSQRFKALARPRPRGVARVELVDKLAAGRFRGRKGALKCSQTYPSAFGAAVAALAVTQCPG